METENELTNQTLSIHYVNLIELDKSKTQISLKF